MVKKIKLTCNWCDDNTLYQRFKRVYISELNFNPEFKFTDSNDYDFLVIINYPQYEINFPKECTLGVVMEPEWRLEFIKSKQLKELCKHILYHKQQNDSQYLQVEGLLPFHFDYTKGNNLDFYINNSFLNNKNKLCSIIVSYYNEDNAHPFFKQSKACLYKERINFVNKILETNLDIDIFGNNWEHSGITDARIKGSLQNKKDGLISYTYSIAIENCVEQGYFTEKITDCILTDTIPIYYGCPNIKKHFLDIPILPDLSNTNFIKNVLSSNVYKPVINKKILATKYNLYNALVEYFTTYV